MNRENMKTIAFALPTANITALSKNFVKEGYAVNLDKQAGTMVVKLDDRVVARALQMGRGRPWSLRAVDGLLTPVEG